MTTRIEDGGELAAHWYENVEVVGRYEAMHVKLADGGVGAIAVLGVKSEQGTVYIDLFDRSDEEAKLLAGQLVRAAGQIQPPIDDTQPLHAAARDDLPALVSISSIALVDDDDAS